MSLAAMPSSRAAAHQTFLAFDFGLKRTGVATGNVLTRTATPNPPSTPKAATHA